MKKLIITVLTVLSLIFILVGCGQVKSGENTKILNDKANNSSSIPSGTEITAEQAEQKALEHASVTADEANFKRTELEFDDGIYKYEIEFYVGTTEYDYEIDANTGNIIFFDKDVD